LGETNGTILDPKCDILLILGVVLGAVSQTFCQSGRNEAAWSNSMTRSARIAVAVALLLGGTSLATAKSRGAAGAHGKPFHLGINETTPRPTVADPYYRLSDSYYGYSDPYHGLFDFYAVPPYSLGYNYGHVRPGGWR
jgi:hypothetical protein